MQSNDDKDPFCTIFTAPWLSPVPFINPETPSLSRNIITADNSVELPKPSPEKPVFIQHDHARFLSHKACLSRKFPEYLVPNVGEGREEQLEARAHRNWIQYKEGEDRLTAESQESFFLPIIRVGPTTFALMQLNYPSQRTTQLRMLGGKCQQKIASSIENATIAADIQTNRLWGRALHNLTRPVRSTLDDNALIDLMNQNDFKLKDGTKSDLVRSMTRYDPSFLNLRVNNEYHEHNTAIKARSPHIGKDRTKFYFERPAPNSFGRVIATQNQPTPYPIDSPTHLVGELRELAEQEIGINYPRVGQRTPRTVKRDGETPEHTPMVHVVDLGHLPMTSDSPNILDPAAMPNLKSQLIYPYLFNNLDATTELQTLATMLFSASSPQFQQISKTVLTKHLEKRYPHEPDGAELPSRTLWPLPQSHATSIALTKALINSSPISPNLTTEQIADHLINDSTHSKSNGRVKTMYDQVFSPKYAQIESLDPRLLLWLLPLIYHWDKPGVIHPVSSGGIKDYHEFTQTERPVQWFQSTALHWVPLHEITNVDPFLAPRYNFNQESVTVTVDKQMNAKQHFDQIREKYQDLRPDLVAAHSDWSKYVTVLPRIERDLLAKVSGCTVAATGINDQGQLLTTSTGAIFPTRQSHLNLLQTEEMMSFLTSVIQKGRADAYQHIPGGEAKIIKRFAKFPEMARHFGYSNEEIRAFAQAKAAKASKAEATTEVAATTTTTTPPAATTTPPTASTAATTAAPTTPSKFVEEVKQ